MAKSNKRNEFRLSALAAALSLAASWVYAAGLGQITVLSPLGQPLRAEIDVNASQEELAAMSARIASPDTFRQVGIDYVSSLSGVRFALDKRKDGQPVLRVTSDRPINEPFLDMLVELTWSSGRMVREYTVLLDPPEGLSQAAPSPAPVSAPQSARPSVAQPPVTHAPTATPTPAPVSVPTPDPASAPKEKAPVQVVKAVPAAESGADHQVQRGETLSKIAAEMKPEGVSLDQMLVALFNANKDAFDGENINRLRAGKILTAPTAEAAAAVAPAEARKIVVAHSRDFNAYRNKLASTVAATPPVKEVAKQADQGKIVPKVADKAAPAETGQDKLAVSRTETAKDSKAIQGRITALEEDLVARDHSLKEANSRVAQLERNLADLKKLAEMKSETAAQMQTQAEAAKAPAVKAPVEVKPAEPVAKPVETPPAVEPVKPAEPTRPAEPPKQAEVPATPPAEPAKPTANVPAPVDEPSFIDENPLLVYGGGGLIALLLGYFAISRRKKTDDVPATASRLSEGDLMASSVFGTTGGQSVDTSASIQTDFSQASLSAIDSEEGVDPVAEADVYMAYGRDAQAEEILLDALKTDPARLAIYLKLLEIYSGHKNLSQFGKIAADLHGQTGGVGAEWDKAAAMGRAIDPGNPLYSTTVVAEPVTEQPVELVVPAIDSEPVPTVSAPDVPAQPAVMEDTVTLPGQLAQLAAAAEQSTSGAPNLGFDLDLGSAPSKAGGAEPGFDLNLDSATAGDAKPVADALDIDLSLETPVAPVAAPEPAASDLDFEFDLDAPVALENPEAQKPTVRTDQAIDFSGINLDLVTTPSPVEDVVEGKLPEVQVDFGDDADVATKLELAQAYEEMGDREGARELLQEVLQEGSSQQQEAARAKLAALDA